MAGAAEDSEQGWLCGFNACLSNEGGPAGGVPHQGWNLPFRGYILFLHPDRRIQPCFTITQKCISWN